MSCDLLIERNGWVVQLLKNFVMAETPIPYETTVSELLSAFRFHYHQLEARVREAVTTSSDSVVLWRLSDDHNEYTGLIHEVQTYLCYIKHSILMITEV